MYKELILSKPTKFKKTKIKKGYVFRKTPIEGIHKVKREGLYKQNRTKYLKEIKDNEKVEESYLRKKRVYKLKQYKSLDKCYKDLSRSWKDQSKKEKQWQ